MRSIEEIKATPHLALGADFQLAPGIVAGSGWIQMEDFDGSVLFGMDEDGWEHVSISHRNPRRLPSWEVMCKVKNMFWKPEEMVVQIHPKESKYFHGWSERPNILHLWRPKDGDWRHLNEL